MGHISECNKTQNLLTKAIHGIPLNIYLSHGNQSGMLICWPWSPSSSSPPQPSSPSLSHSLSPSCSPQPPV